MTTQQAAEQFTNLCREGKFDAAGKQFWSDEVISVEPMSGDMHEKKGRRAVEDKGRWWSENHQVHSWKVEGPFVNGDQFVLRFEFELTPKGKNRTTMREVGLYTMKNDKITEERFFNS
jgi:hypothetical protein